VAGDNKILEVIIEGELWLVEGLVVHDMRDQPAIQVRPNDTDLFRQSRDTEIHNTVPDFVFCDPRTGTEQGEIDLGVITCGLPSRGQPKAGTALQVQDFLP
jgi:hypothetical protein